MKWNQRIMKNLLIACWIISLGAFAGCSTKPGEGREPAVESTFIYVNTASDQNLGSIDISEEIVISSNLDKLRGRIKGDKIAASKAYIRPLTFGWKRRE